MTPFQMQSLICEVFDKMDINFALVDVEATCQITNMKCPQLLFMISNMSARCHLHQLDLLRKHCIISSLIFLGLFQQV